jgi:hypothetical protein
MQRLCQKCKRIMVKGFTLDLTHGGQWFARWVEGEPDPAWTGSVKTKGRDCRAIETWRCGVCGFLESYAIQETAPPSWNHH